MSNILKRMAIFSKVVDCGAFSMAAKELGMTTSAVSQHIRQLEEHLGIQLLLRSTRSLSLTEAGLCFYEDCLLMIHAAERGQQRIAALRGELVGELRVATSTEFATHYLVPALQSFLDEHPRLTLRLEIHDEKIDLIAQRIDLAIRGGVLADSSYVSTRLARCREVLCASPAYLAHHGVPDSPQALTHHHWVTFTPLGNPQFVRLIHRNGDEHRMRMTGRLFTNSGMAMKELALTGKGIIRNFFANVERELRSGELIEILPDWRLPEINCYAIMPRREIQPLKVRRLLEHMKLYLQEKGLTAVEHIRQE
ncbi:MULTISPECIES: LysR family transcriptional regulator [Serratia]|jgi:DNA-binding transcriptional LysR family regulator|uniref:LysR family transcriptional regulator n=2 Tax=Serratia TaxID=613 RepID=A0A5C7CE63_SERMA|nr:MULTISPECIES: LysR family transcriptional regulator [Serratia]SOD35290.1 transcriptional regulator, LysR family [Serratia sp. JKS296]ASM15211.1 LysR family transcriptional regulator [Serratia marcescens]AXK22459.1 LysR substrate binding domain protein [Serratia marcescens]EGT0452677.1 LysR family transcriptional regulator [Serratia marcescens]EKX2167108.1 LysR family transcriptional regulator [Serratia marcescens]